MPNISTPTLGEPAIETCSAPTGAVGIVRVVEVAMLVVAAIFALLHFVHLKADFPNQSFWRDWAKFTDEGWYADAAIRFYQFGHWSVPGDFNPAAALPVWPAILVVLFRFTGVSLVAARALTGVVFGLTLVCCYWLLRRWMGRDGQPSLVPAAVVVLLAVSPFCFAFTRMAILEPLLVLLMLVALLVASAAGEASGFANVRAKVLWTVGLGLLLPVMVLTKTTAVFLFPAILWMLWAATGYRLREFLRVALPACCLGAAVWGLYFGLLVRPRYLVDYHYLFDANAYTGFKWDGFGMLLFNTAFDGIWIGKTLFALSLAAVVGALAGIFAKGLRKNPLPATMMLWILGYGAFMAYHANLQPRYYLVVVVPLTVLVGMVMEPLFVSAARTWSKDAAPAGAIDVFLLRVTAGLAGGALLFAFGNAARQTVGFVLYPEYTWVNAAARVKEAVEREAAVHPAHSRLILSISGSDLSLMTGLPSICDDFGSMSLDERITTYRPGWFATWNEVEDDKMEALAPMYRLVRVLSAPAFDDTDRNLLILYRLDVLEVPGPEPARRPRRKAFVPKSMRSTIPVQPDATEMEP